MPQDYSLVLPLIIDKKPFQPVVKGWNRLEGRPRQKDFARSLRAEIRDPLWMLARQWQWGEFQGEDAGSPIDAFASVRQTQVNRYIVNGEAYPYTGEIPLEVQVEAEPVLKDITVQMQLARYLLKLIAGEPNFETIKKALISTFPLDEQVAGFQDDDSALFINVAATKTFDGFKLMDDVARNDLTAINALPDLNPNEKKAVKDAALKLSDYYHSLYNTPADSSKCAWKPDSLEYRFGCSAENAEGVQAILESNDYRGGHLDWFDFNIESSETSAVPDAPDVAIPAPRIAEEGISFLPVPIEFNGMPAHRYWEMEDHKTEFADITVNTTDTAKLLLTEFVLMFSNDWCIIPYEVSAGSLVEMKGLVVTDTFGLQTFVRPGGQGVDNNWQRWGMFNMNTHRYFSDNRIFVAPSIMKSLEGEDIEKVNFLRDEMANMVWAVQTVIPNKMGIGTNGFEAATKITPPGEPPSVDPDAPAKYILGKEVPLNWTPFVPAHAEGSNRSIQLQRAQMPDAAGIHPGGAILDIKSPYYIHEEQVPRSGTIVARNFQRSRGPKGEVFLWLGRKVTNGKGEGSSGLIFDQIS